MTVAIGRAEDLAIYICHACGQPNYFNENDEQIPAPRFGAEIANLPANVASLYKEARDCISVGAYTASAMCSRKLLMNFAVDHKADEGWGFKAYVNYIVDKNLVVEGCRPAAKRIQKLGGAATHEVEQVAEADAKDLLVFLEAVFKFNYEYPARFPAPAPGQENGKGDNEAAQGQ